jgi:hypothetical protein
MSGVSWPDAVWTKEEQSDIARRNSCELSCEGIGTFLVVSDHLPSLSLGTQ